MFQRAWNVLNTHKVLCILHYELIFAYYEQCTICIRLLGIMHDICSKYVHSIFYTNLHFLDIMPFKQQMPRIGWYMQLIEWNS